jgi:hypothetical protein
MRLYLELALRRDLPLATLDTDLRRAALAEKVSLLGGWAVQPHCLAVD